MKHCTFSIHFQKCSLGKYKGVGYIGDYDYDSDEVELTPKKGENENYCPLGEVCCIPAEPQKCEDTKGHRCVEEDVSVLKFKITH